MQTFTLFFGFAIVAIAMENLTSKFLFVEPSDADAKGLPEFQSRAEGSIGKYHYILRGTTGKEKVSITDGKKTKEYSLENELELYAVNSKIIIDYTNDECCMPDRNVMFASDFGYPHTISTASNPFPQNYLEKWNCSSCPDKSLHIPKKRMDLQSRAHINDRCGEVRNTTDDFCDNCKILKDGQFCHPGKYTIEFKLQGQCKGVTFGGCEYPREKTSGSEEDIESPTECRNECSQQATCNYYRYNNETKLCSFLKEQNRNLYCNIWAGPMDKTADQCLNEDNHQDCDALLHEECEYNGDLVKRYRPGQVVSPEICQDRCKAKASKGCKYWVYNKEERDCILLKDDKRTCTTWGGPQSKEWEYCRNNFPN